MSDTNMVTGTDVWFAGAFMRVLLGSEDTGGVISIMEHRYPAGWSPPLHVHHREDQVLHVVEGEIRAVAGEGPEIVLRAGESAFLRRDVPHCFVAGPDGARMLEINTPGGFERFHLEAGVPATEARIPDTGDVDVAALAAAIGPYDAELLGPPMR